MKKFKLFIILMLFTSFGYTKSHLSKATEPVVKNHWLLTVTDSFGYSDSQIIYEGLTSKSRFQEIENQSRIIRENGKVLVVDLQDKTLFYIKRFSKKNTIPIEIELLDSLKNLPDSLREIWMPDSSMVHYSLTVDSASNKVTGISYQLFQPDSDNPENVELFTYYLRLINTEVNFNTAEYNMDHYVFRKNGEVELRQQFNGWELFDLTEI